MSTATWLAIAAIVVPSITTMIAARLSVYWSIKANLPTAAPATNQPKQRIARTERESQSRWKKFAAGLVGTSGPLALLAIAMSRAVIDRWAVLAISVSVGWIAIQVSISVSIYAVHRIWVELNTG